MSGPQTDRRVRIATRSSPLARWQAEHVAALLRAVEPGLEVDLVFVDTTGDRLLDRPLAAIGGQGVFVKEVQAAVLEGRADLAVHSAKDLPSVTAPGLWLVSVPERGDPRDALVGAALDGLAEGAVVATGSPRRQAQLAALRPDLRFVGLRGNIATRLAKVPAGGAVVVAAVALERLGLADRAAEVLDPERFVPQVAQGALAIECRAGDEATAALARAVEHGPSRRAVDAERAFLATLGGGCDLPVGAHAREAAPAARTAAGPGEPGTLVLDGLLAGGVEPGAWLHRATRTGADPVALGRAVAGEVQGHVPRRPDESGVAR